MEEAQYCQPCGHSPGSRASCSGVRRPACKATKLPRHQNPCLSRSAEAACTQAPMQNVDTSSAPPGLPPLVFVDQSSGGRPPTVVFSPNASGRVQSNSYLFFFQATSTGEVWFNPTPWPKCFALRPPSNSLWLSLRPIPRFLTSWKVKHEGKPQTCQTIFWVKTKRN